MKKIIMITLFLSAFSMLLSSPRTTYNLNGRWQFEQTDAAVPPKNFTRTIPVPGLVHLAEPKIEQHDNLYAKSKSAEFKTDHRVLDLQYDPKYNWYRKTINVPKALEGQQAVLTIKKAKYVTQVFINGMDAGASMECYTPVEFPVTTFLKWDEKNEILVRVGDRAWLPSPAAGSTDKEKVNYIPGIWDDVELSFTGVLRLHKTLVLPSVEDNKIDVKLKIRNFFEAQQVYGEQMQDTCLVRINVFEKSSDQPHGDEFRASAIVTRDNVTQVNFSVPILNAKLWSPDRPFLYVAQIELLDKNGQEMDRIDETFGMRDFERRGKYFYLNGKRTFLRGTNVTLHRFFEDPDCRALPCDRD